MMILQNVQRNKQFKKDTKNAKQANGDINTIIGVARKIVKTMNIILLLQVQLGI